ncbi:hypothetical protein BG015_002986 [Linnemannia schmuckeri]|uniref:Uncharacterized protein n=1 Tax=Linnemannia schmuckeri TaxID=64567 RepID=A0A9P5RRE9_9FUNG|nr:hypothetical protein BG015_002986 [Linnemannia schmuckeri]
MDDEPTTQTFINQVNDQIVHVPVIYHTELRQNVVFWDDILRAFPGVANLAIKHGAVAVTPARNSLYHYMEPKCIVHQPNVTLTVILGELLPPNSNPDRPRTPVPRTDNDTTLVEGDGGESAPFAYAGSVIFSEVSSHKGPHGGPRPVLDIGVEGENASVQDIEEVTVGTRRIEFGGFSAFKYHQSPDDLDHIATAIPAINSSSDNNHINGGDRSITPPLSTTSSSESGSGSGVSTSSATNIPPSNIDTAGSGTSTTSGTTVLPESTEIDPVEATSSWASIFRTLGDLQEQYQLTPEETTKMFTEISQSA